jgi:hypothetical protein
MVASQYACRIVTVRTIWGSVKTAPNTRAELGQMDVWGYQAYNQTEEQHIW